MRIARRAGSHAAAGLTSTSHTVVPAKLAGSFGLKRPQRGSTRVRRAHAGRNVLVDLLPNMPLDLAPERRVELTAAKDRLPACASIDRDGAP
jgi:hypothetical protein